MFPLVQVQLVIIHVNVVVAADESLANIHLRFAVLQTERVNCRICGSSSFFFSQRHASSHRTNSFVHAIIMVRNISNTTLPLLFMLLLLLLLQLTATFASSETTFGCVFSFIMPHSQQLFHTKYIHNLKN